jgi:LmbE family N-acetylglucosaminyl deacetylase
MVAAAHPDDETLGCGGTLLKHKANGDQLFWLIATEMKKEDGFKEQEIQSRENEIKLVSDLYGFNAVYKLNLPTTKINRFTMDELIGKVSRVMNDVKPDILYLPFKNDAHSDHRILFDSAYSCTKVFRYPFLKKILMMETISETEFAPSLQELAFVPNSFVDITDYIYKKMEIMKIFKTEIDELPFPRSSENIKALATFRGAMAGCKYAESFVLLKEIR